MDGKRGHVTCGNRLTIEHQKSFQNFASLGPVYTGPDKFWTDPLRDLIGSVPKRSHESSPELFQIARPFTWDRIIHQIAKITAVFVERHLVVEEESPPKS